MKDLSAIRSILANLSHLTDNFKAHQILSSAKAALDELMAKNAPSLSDEEKELIIKDRASIAAIKAYRERTGHNLITAKTVVDQYRDSLRSKTPEQVFMESYIQPNPGEVSVGDYVCPKCNTPLDHLDGYSTEEAESATTDCKCGALLVIKDGKALDFHAYMSEINPQWPKDGTGTESISF